MKAEWVCELCGKRFGRYKRNGLPSRFCGQSCYRTWRKDNHIMGGQFQKGHVPWNKSLTERTWVPVGTIRIRIKNGRECAWVKVALPNVWKPRAYVVWEEAGGPELPKGHFLLHLDGDSLNDELVNLAAVTRAFQLELLRRHHPSFGEKRRLAQRKARYGW